MKIILDFKKTGFKLTIYKERHTKLKKDRKAEITKASISQPIVNDIVRKIDDFESKKQFIENTDLHSLKLLMGHNTKYISQVILLYRGKKFTAYINDFRIEYAVELLTTGLKYNLYICCTREGSGFFKFADIRSII